MDDALKTTSRCLQCGRCTSGCDINRHDPSFAPHRIVHLLCIGMKDEAISDSIIWKCSTCFTCSERCPQGIRVTQILWSLKEQAAKTGKGPDFLLKQRETIIRHSRLLPITDKENAKRQKAGLPTLEEVLSQASRLLGERT